MNAKNGRYHEVREHGEAIIRNPKRYGLTKSEVAAIVGPEGTRYRPQDTSAASARAKLLKEAMRNGWVRIRGQGPYWSVQFLGNAKQAVGQFLKKVAPEYLGYAGTVRISDLATGQAEEFSIKELEHAHQEGHFGDYTGPALDGDEDAGRKQAGKGKAKKVEGIPSGMPDHVARQWLRGRMMKRIGPTIRQYNEGIREEALWGGGAGPDPRRVERWYSNRCHPIAERDLDPTFEEPVQEAICEALYGGVPTR